MVQFPYVYGKAVKEEKIPAGSASVSIDLSALDSGAYFVIRNNSIEFSSGQELILVKETGFIDIKGLLDSSPLIFLVRNMVN